MSHTCSVCGKSVTPAAHQFCIKNEYPVMCHKHQQEYGVNRYHVLTEVEKQIAKEQAEKENVERINREQQRKENIIPIIEDLVKEITVNRKYHYRSALIQELEAGRKENIITPQQYNHYIAIYNTNKNAKELSSKQKADIWNKEIIKEIEKVVKNIIQEIGESANIPNEAVYKVIEPIKEKYIYVEDKQEDYFDTFLQMLQESTNSFYYEDGNEIAFGYKM